MHYFPYRFLLLHDLLKLVLLLIAYRLERSPGWSSCVVIAADGGSRKGIISARAASMRRACTIGYLSKIYIDVD
jgi:hypothetical protein